MDDGEVAHSFCAPPASIDLTDQRSVIIQGPRGSGKSTLLRQLVLRPTEETVQQSGFIPTYVSLAREWVAGNQRHTHLSPQARSALFSLALNTHIARSLGKTIGRLLALRPEDSRPALEAKVVQAVSDLFIRRRPLEERSLAAFSTLLTELEREQRDYSLRALFGARSEPPTTWVLSDVFEPIRNAVGIVNDVLGCEIRWVFAFDELDNLGEFEQKHFNTIIRNSGSPVAIKAACLPHGHRTLTTLAADNPIVLGHDFEYAAIRTDPKRTADVDFCVQLVRKRLSLKGISTIDNPTSWLPARPLRRRAELSLEGTDTPTLDAFAEVAGVADITTDNGRQYIPALCLRALKQRSRGNAAHGVYAGWEDVVAASDANPRRLLRLLDRLFEASNDGSRALSEIEQSRLIRRTAQDAVDKLVALPAHGRQIDRLVRTTGDQLEKRLHEPNRVRQDSCSVNINIDAQPEHIQSALKTAIDYGVLCPWEFDRTSGYPRGEHSYWLSFSLAPRFWLVLRHGVTVESLEPSFGDQLTLEFDR